MREVFQKRASGQGLSLNGHVQPFNLQEELDRSVKVMEAVRDKKATEADIQALLGVTDFALRPSRRGVCWYAGETPTLDFCLYRTHLSLGRYEADGRRSTLKITRAPSMIMDVISWLQEWRGPFVLPEHYAAHDRFLAKLQAFYQKLNDKMHKKGWVEKIRKVAEIPGISHAHVLKNMTLEIELVQRLNASMAGLQLHQSKEIIDRLFEFKLMMPSNAPADLAKKMDDMVAKAGVSRDLIGIANKLAEEKRGNSLQAASKKTPEAPGATPLSGSNFWQDLSFIDGLNNPWTLLDLLNMYPVDQDQLKQIFHKLRASKGDKEFIR
jgi:hypothetical protein